MQPGRDSSLLKGLAIAFGNGLAVGVGMKLLQPSAPARTPAPRPAVETGLDPKVLEGVAQAIEERLRDQAARLEKRIAGLEAGIDEELQRLHTQDQGLGKRLEDNLGALRAEIVEMHREFAGAVGRIVAEQVQTELAARLKEAEERNQTLHRRVEDEVRALRSEVAATRLDVADSIGRALTDQVEAAVQAAVAQRLAPVTQFADAMSRACSELTAKVSPPAPESNEPAPPAAKPPTTAVQSEPAESGPQFTQLKRSSELWRIPLVSSFILTAGALFVTRFL